MNGKGSIGVGFALIALLSFLAGSFVPLARAQEGGKILIAFVDKAKIAEKLDSTQAMERALEKKRAVGEKKLETRREALRRMREELALLSEESQLHRKKRNDFRMQKAILRVEEENLKSDLQAELLRATRKTYEAIEAYCGTLRQREGYAAILAVDNAVVLASDPALDLTAEVIRGLNGR
ncbi:MAG: OmpH/Skp family outer membrane protein [Planctomycetota bacterium]|jgi:Skp family chaperone for outer membrane proteins